MLRVAQWLAIGLIISTDQLLKVWANVNLSFFSEVTVLPKLLSLQLVHNFGAAYGILQNQRILLVSISLIVLVGSIIFQKQIATSRYSLIGLVFLIGGTAGNLIDRMFRGYVIDFLNIHIIPVFNLADVAINIAILAFLIDIIVAHRHEKHNR